MTIDTKHVRERRKLRFADFQEVLSEVDRLAARQTRVLGNWSFPQICQHLAVAMRLSMDGAPSQPQRKAPLWLRLLGRVLKRRVLTRGMSPGFKLPPQAPAELASPDDTTIESSVAALRESIRRLAVEERRWPHPIFGSLSRAEWDQLHLRHAEMHLGFVVPSE